MKRKDTECLTRIHRSHRGITVLKDDPYSLYFIVVDKKVFCLKSKWVLSECGDIESFSWTDDIIAPFSILSREQKEAVFEKLKEVK